MAIPLMGLPFVNIDKQTQEIRDVGIELKKQQITAQIEASKPVPVTVPPPAPIVVQTAPIAPKPAPVAPTGTCGDWMNQAGVTDHANAHILIMRESGCRPTARNASSGAYGIPQSLPASKIAHCGDDPVCQIKWMQDYVNRRYNGWAGAVAHSNAKGWY